MCGKGSNVMKDNARQVYDYKYRLHTRPPNADAKLHFKKAENYIKGNDWKNFLVTISTSR